MASNETTYQVQLRVIDGDGNETKINPKNDVRDVHTGLLSNGELKLPGSDANEMLAVTMSNIRRYLSNLASLASTAREVSNNDSDTSKVNIPTTEVTTGLKTSITALEKSVKDLQDAAETFAPKSHAAAGTTYGGATGSLYGHVKLSDTYASAVTNGAAANSIGASQSALYNAYNTLNTNKAPNDHAVNAATYGKGSSSLYGHVKTSNTYNSTSTDAAEVATRKALFDAYTALNTSISTNATNIDGKAPKSHASSATTYGVGTTGNYGHLKINDGYNTDNSSSGAAANAVAASSWAVYRAYSSLSTVINGKLASTHADEKATASTFSHVKLTDTYNSSQGAASSGIAPSSKALYDAYAALSSSITTLQSAVDTLNSTSTKNLIDYIRSCGITIQAEALRSIHTNAQAYSRWALAVNVMESLHADKNGYYGNNGLGDTERIVVVSLENPEWEYFVPTGNKSCVIFTGSIIDQNNTIPACGQWGNRTSLADYGWVYNTINASCKDSDYFMTGGELFDCYLRSSIEPRGVYICTNGIRISTEGDWRITVYLLIVV